MSELFSNTKKLGLGCMRLPVQDGEPDYEQVCPMIDAFMAEGFHYFDTAHGYMDGKSEVVVQRCLTSH